MPIAKPKPVVLSTFVKSNMDGPVLKECLIHGPPKVGKTRLAATLDPAFPQEVPAKEKTSLSKTLWVTFDKRGTDSLRGLNLEVDQIPVWEMVDNSKKESQLPNLLGVIIDIIREQVSEHGKEIIVIDTISKMDMLGLFHYETVAPLKTNNDKRDSFALERALNRMHLDVNQKLGALPCSIIWLCHTKKMGETEQQSAKVVSLPGQPLYVLDLYYKRSAGVYRKDGSHVFTLQIDDRTGERVLFTKTDRKSGNQLEAGNRYQDHWDIKEPPHLRKLVEKVEKALG